MTALSGKHFYYDGFRRVCGFFLSFTGELIRVAWLEVTALHTHVGILYWQEGGPLEIH